LKKKIIVIGGGFGGLGAACRLAARGNEVELIEKRNALGGCAFVYNINGFKFDGGPTVITAPFMLDDIFIGAGKNREDYFKLVPVDPFFRIFDDDGKPFNYSHNMDINNEIARWNSADRIGYKRFIQTTRAIFKKGFNKFTRRPFLRITDMLRVVPELMRLPSFISVYQYVSLFVKDDFLRRVLSVHLLMIGGNPFNTPSIYAVHQYIEREWGVHHAIGGTGAVVEGLGKLLTDLGGKITLNTEVTEILVRGRVVTGVRLADGSIHRADVIVSNADLAFTYRNLLPIKRRRWMYRRVSALNYSLSLFVIYFGTRKRYTNSGLAHHNIIMSQRYKELINDIFNRKVLADNFTLFLHMPTITDSSIAPEGCESFCVVSPVPNQASGIDWNKAARPYRDKIIKFLEDNYLPDLRANIISEHYIDPLHFQSTLNNFQGAAFSVQPTLTQSAWFRPHNRSEEYDNLYFVGAGTHPGAGLPGVLSSANIVENLVEASK
jgi:phytoene desaturase